MKTEAECCNAIVSETMYKLLPVFYFFFRLRLLSVCVLTSSKCHTHRQHSIPEYMLGLCCKECRCSMALSFVVVRSTCNTCYCLMPYIVLLCIIWHISFVCRASTFARDTTDLFISIVRLILYSSYSTVLHSLN